MKRKKHQNARLFAKLLAGIELRDKSLRARRKAKATVNLQT